MMKFQSVATCRRKSPLFKVRNKSTKVYKDETGGVTCDSGYHVINCVFFTYWKRAPPGVELDRTVPTCSVTCSVVAHCVLSAICLSFIPPGNYYLVYMIYPIECEIFGEVSHILINQKRENSAFSPLIG